MAKVSVVVSDYSGEQLSPDDHVVVTYEYQGKRFRLDAAYSEVAEDMEKAVPAKRSYTRKTTTPLTDGN